MPALAPLIELRPLIELVEIRQAQPAVVSTGSTSTAALLQGLFKGRAGGWQHQTPGGPSMARSHKIMSTAGLGMAVVLLAGCGNGTAHKPVAAAASPSQVGTPKVITANAKACAGAQGVLGHLAADTVHWSPTQKPFDK